MKLRQASTLDLSILRPWDTKPHVIAARGDHGRFDWEAELPRQVSWRELLIAEDEGRPVGVLQVIDPAEEESHYWGDVAPNLRAIDIWIGEESDLGRGHGSTMMHLALSRCFSNPRVVGGLNRSAA